MNYRRHYLVITTLMTMTDVSTMLIFCPTLITSTVIHHPTIIHVIYRISVKFHIPYSGTYPESDSAAYCSTHQMSIKSINFWIWAIEKHVNGFFKINFCVHMNFLKHKYSEFF